MQSDGGLANINNFTGLKAILSGPAGGVVGHARTSYDPAHAKPVIGFDMGGEDLFTLCGFCKKSYAQTLRLTGYQVPAQMSPGTMASSNIRLKIQQLE
jgi:hypothetical protein